MGGSGWALSHPAPWPAPSPPRGPTCAKNPRVLRRAWSILLVKRARSWRQVSAQPLTLPQSGSAAPRSRSVSRGSSAAGAQTGQQGTRANRGAGNGAGRGIPPPQQGRDAACRSPQPPQTAPSSYLAGLLWLNVKERREGLQQRGGQRPPRAELVPQTITAPPQTPVAVPMPVIPPG